MTQWRSPSGSRWEPVPQAGSDLSGSGRGVAADLAPDPDKTVELRRRRSPVLVVLIALLNVGAATAGGQAATRPGASA